ncbi:MAG: hypothetical protein NXI31_11510 [bacterium]|nr:hypothetical protein [bacterium]
MPVAGKRPGEEVDAEVNAQVAAIEAVWQDLVRHLHARSRDLECEDDVQEAIVGLLEFLARHRDESSDSPAATMPSQQELFAIADRIQRCRRVDRLRRLRPQLLGESDQLLPEPEEILGDREIPQELRERLKPKALELLQAWLDGCRSKKALARRLATSAAAIRLRMRRLVATLEAYLVERRPEFVPGTIPLQRSGW